jgi:hypothetical protein
MISSASALGTKTDVSVATVDVALQGKADVPWKRRHFRFLTRNRH